ncbi:hypothetical protein [Marinimicrobium agarilyticum]|uniref:hypothetical protein n=1 Tax=Marinimicrobium agarilyticum TaxID=306546 RepID=UPI00041CE68A|nr:hypothetical protein [Marinimicrobium agarilyticum]
MLEAISAISSMVMAAVWVIYFQFFYFQYRRGNRPYLVVHHAQNESPESLCMLVNMSAEPVHIQVVQVVVKDRSGGERVLTVTDYERVLESRQPLQHSLRQGPLCPGEYLMLGSFRSIILGQKSEDEESVNRLREVESLEIRVAVIHGPSPFPVGARRVFAVHQNEGTRIVPYNVFTEQLTRRRNLSTVRKWLEQELHPENPGGTESDTSEQSADR